MKIKTDSFENFPTVKYKSFTVYTVQKTWWSEPS